MNKTIVLQTRQALTTKLTALAGASQLNITLSLPTATELQSAFHGDVNAIEVVNLKYMTAIADLLTALETREDAS